MNIAVWIATGLLAALMLAAGSAKLIQPYDKVRERMAWAEDFSPRTVKLIGTAEVLGAIGLVVPVLTGILPILTPIAACGIAALQIGAIVTHARRREFTMLVGNVVILALAVFIAVARFAGV